VKFQLGHELLLDGIAVSQLHRGREHFLERQLAELGQHHHQSAGIARCDSSVRPFRGRIFRRVRFHRGQIEKECRRGPRRRDTERINAYDFLRLRIENECLRLATPAHVVMHRAHDGKHGARGIDGIAAALEHPCPRHRAQRLARDGNPMPPVQHWFVSARKRFRSGSENGSAERSECNEGPKFHS
jgi:hypothetical protein